MDLLPFLLILGAFSSGANKVRCPGITMMPLHLAQLLLLRATSPYQQKLHPNFGLGLKSHPKVRISPIIFLRTYLTLNVVLLAPSRAVTFLPATTSTLIDRIAFLFRTN
jgi:hypothetical protein